MNAPTDSRLDPRPVPSSALASTHCVPFDGSFELSAVPTAPDSDTPGRKTLKKELRGLVKVIADEQRKLYADDRFAVLLVFQAMDAAGKDSTIRAVMSGVNPAGCQVFSFKRPSTLELDHDFLWRSAVRLPERGRIGVFNRSYYEEVLVVRVHPEILQGQRLPALGRESSTPGSIAPDGEAFWQQRLQSIADHERHLSLNGTVILKFWLNVSLEEQRRRFLSRLDEPEKNWKFSVQDVRERGFWHDYMQAYQAALSATSKPWAPWFAVPADDKRFMRREVARIVADTLRGLPIRYPSVAPEDRARFDEMRALLSD